MSKQQDIEMTGTSSNKIEAQAPNDTKPLYADYKKVIYLIEKSALIKDSKALSQFFNSVNNFRFGFSQDDFTYITNVLVNNPFSQSLVLDQSTKDKLNLLFNLNSKSVTKVCEIKEIYYFNLFLLILHAIDDGQNREGFEYFRILLNQIKSYNSTNIWALKAKAYYYYCLQAERIGAFTSIIK